MFVVVGVAAGLCVASYLIGVAVLALVSGRERLADSWLAAAIGLAALLAAAVIGARIGDGTGSAVAIAFVLVATAGALAVLQRRSNGGFSVHTTEKAPLGHLGLGLTVVIAALGAASLPFLIAGHTGVLGVGLINDDMASHLQIAEHVREPLADPPRFAEGGYPIGPHAIVAGLASGLGLSIVDAFAALSVAIAPLLALTLLAGLEHLPPARRALAALVAALSYLSAAYIAQGAFKEPLEAVIVIAFALYVADLVGLGRADPAVPGERPAAWRAAPAALLAAASVLNYSLPGLLWLLAVAAVILGLRYYVIGPRPQRLAIAWRRLAPYAVAGLAILALATASEWSRIADFTRLDAFRPDRVGSDLGNLRQSISPAEVLGIWPTGDFRTTAADAGPPAPLFWLGGAFALAVAIAGAIAAWSARRLALLGALGATTAIWAATAIVSTPYFAAKALAIAAPAVMAISLGWALVPGSRLRALAAAGLLAGALASSFLALRTSPVGPDAHAAELDRIRPHVEGSRVLFLGRDDFIGWHLRRAEVDGVVKNHFNVGRVPARFRNPNGTGDKFDIDAVTPKGLRRYDFVLMTSGQPRSDPGDLPPVERTESYDLYEVTKPASEVKRRTLDEGAEPGAKLRCRRGLGKRKRDAMAFASPFMPVYGEIPGGEVTATDGDPAFLELTAPVLGPTQLSIAYDSRRPLHISAPGLDATLPANLDFRGPGPLFPVGTIVPPTGGTFEVSPSGGTTTPIDVSIEPEEPNLLARILRAPNEAHIRAVALSTPYEGPPVPMRGACGRYLDYYTP